MNTFEYFVNYILPPFVFFIGQSGNAMGVFILMKKKLKKIGPRSMYRYLFVMDSLYLLFLLESYTAISFRVNILSLIR
jgi:hypothetical protein